jgi:hypothetical protein
LISPAPFEDVLSGQFAKSFRGQDYQEAQNHAAEYEPYSQKCVSESDLGHEYFPAQENKKRAEAAKA